MRAYTCICIHRSARSGVFVANCADAVVEHSHLFACGYAAVECNGQGRVELQSNRIRDGHRGGVLALGRSQLLMADNQVTGNAMAGATVRGAAQACLLRNQLSDGRASGCYVCEEARVWLLHNVIRGNKLAGVEVGTSSGGGGLRGAPAVCGAWNVFEGNGLSSGCAPGAVCGTGARTGTGGAVPLYEEAAEQQAAERIERQAEDAAQAMRVDRASFSEVDRR